MHRGPDRRAGLRVGRVGGDRRRGAGGFGHVIHGNDDFELELLPHADVDDRDPAGLAVGLLAAEEAGQLVQRALRGGQADPLRGRVAGAGDQPLQTLQRQRQVRPPLGGGHSVDLVDDDVLDRLQHGGGRRRQHEVERLGGRDEDVGRVAPDAAAVGLGRVTGAGGDSDGGRRPAGPLRLRRQAGERRTEVALHVVAEGLQRRDVEDAAALAGRGRRRRPEQAVERPQEGGQRLPRAGRGQDERVVAPGDRLPALFLGGRRRLERRREPGPRDLGEPVERPHCAQGMTAM